MKTERWAMDYEFCRPPRWNPASDPRPAVVYLDQWCFDRLVRDRAGECSGSTDEGTYECLKRLAHAGKIAIVLSQAHYRENRSRENVDARWDTAVVMAELTGFTTITTKGLASWEALMAVAAYGELGLEIPKPDPLGWGFSHCIRGVSSAAYIQDVETGQRADWSHLPPDQQRELAHLEEEMAYRFELMLLAGREPRHEDAAGFMPFPPVPNDDGAKFEAQQRELRELVEEHGATAVQIRNWLEFLSFRDSKEYITDASIALGLSPNAIFEKLVVRVEAGDVTALHDFLAAMPIQRIFAELRVRAHMKGNFNFKPSDLVDFFAIATVLPFVDFVVLDKRSFNLLSEAGIDSWHSVRAMRRLADLRATLDLAA